MNRKPYVKQVRFEHDWFYAESAENYCTIRTTGTAAVKVYPPDPDTWDSDWDYYGYTELLGQEVKEVLKINEDGTEENYFPKISLDSKSYEKYINDLDMFIEKSAY